MLGPNDTMNRFGWSVPDGAAGIGFLCCFRSAFVALRHAFFDQFHLSIVAGRATFDERYIGRQAHTIHMITCLTIVQRIQHHIESLKETYSVISTIQKKSINIHKNSPTAP